MSLKPVKIGICGLGTVGSGTFNVLARNADQVEARAQAVLQVVHVGARRDNPACEVGHTRVSRDIFAAARDPAVGIPDIEKLEPNIHAGIKYMRWIVDTYFADSGLDPLQQTLFAFASYNAGPNRIRGLRREAAKKGYDPDVWFRNVEVVVWEKLGREPVQYVSNIYKYYIAYERMLMMEQTRNEARQDTSSPR